MKAAVLALAFLLGGAGLAAACESAPAAVATDEDVAGRAVAPVFVNGHGPFRFIIDTGANRSVLSERLATRLGILPVAMGEVHSVMGAHPAPMAPVRTLRMGAFALDDAHLPLIDGPVLAGQEGLLGFDGMAGRRLTIDFERGCIDIVESAGAAPLEGWLEARGQVRFGSLMVTHGEIQGVRVNVLIDTGSDISLANPAFRTALGRVRARLIEYRGERAFTAGRPVLLDEAVWAPRIHVGDTRMSNVIAYVGDYHIFRLWGLADEPTVLVGIDVLAQSGAMALDYERGLIQFKRPPRGLWR